MIEILVSKYRLNHNQRKEAEEIIQELMLKNTSFKPTFFENFEADTHQISDAFITWLRELRYPEYSSYRRNLSSLLSAIHNNNSCFRVIYNDNFEGDEYEIVYLDTSSAKQKEKLEEKKEYLKQLTELIKGKTKL